MAGPRKKYGPAGGRVLGESSTKRMESNFMQSDDVGVGIHDIGPRER